ncbi:MAG: hypothetical protein IKC59_03945 [Clostridia bacterium]|nr:hypothetical protein [Clostridia bacterium]
MKNGQRKSQPQSRYHPAVRIMALLLSLLVTGGVLTYLVWFITSLF